MGAEEVERFLTHLATTDKVAASTQNQALNALVFLYREVLRMDLGNFDAVRARRPLRVPTVLSQVEARQLLDAVAKLKTTESYHLMCQLMYGSGLRLMECCRLRVKDVDLARSGVARPQRRLDDDDLHSRHGKGGVARAQPARRYWGVIAVVNVRCPAILGAQRR
jgi:site-specific recombinase XerD